MATGLAIMGFGGGAMIGAPLADRLMKYFATPTSVGVWETFLCFAVIYFIFMTFGAFGYRLPHAGWQPKGWTPPPPKERKMMTDKHVHVNVAIKTPQFWLMWWVLCLNVSAGIGIIGMASPMLQEIFAGKLIGVDTIFNNLTPAQKVLIAAIAAGFTGLLSLFNIAGRIIWASLSDYMGRKTTYYTFFTLGFILYASAPWSAQAGYIPLFVISFGIILSMYGGGFATVPAYLADIFGTQMVGAIHGRLITAWSAAGIFGPVIVNYLREYQLAKGMPHADVYTSITYTLAGLLVLGFICNFFIKPLNPKYYMTDEQLETERKLAHEAGAVFAAEHGSKEPTGPLRLVLTWLIVIIPLCWGIWIALITAQKLFR
jgi:MFS family permease